MAKRILIVDDSSNTRSVLSFLLKNQGFDLVEAENGEEALAKAKSRYPDLVILDVLMPGMSGFDVCRELKKSPETSDLPVILLTAVPQTDPNRDWSKESPADRLIAKPFQLRDLLKAIEQLLGIPFPEAPSGGSGGDKDDKHGTVIIRPPSPLRPHREG